LFRSCNGPPIADAIDVSADFKSLFDLINHLLRKASGVLDYQVYSSQAQTMQEKLAIDNSVGHVSKPSCPVAELINGNFDFVEQSLHPLQGHVWSGAASSRIQELLFAEVR
jgi:hypothetical protein